MVMRKKNVMVKNLLRTIRGSFGRYVAIVAIIALGASIFVGLLSTKTDMVATGQVYMDEQNMFDLRLLSTYGWSQAEVEQIAKLSGIAYAEGSISIDVLGGRYSGENDAVYKVHSIPENVNKVYLLGGRMPTSPNECLVDGHLATDKVLGTTFKISEENASSTLEMLSERTFTVVGYISTPLYMDMSRGSTTLGNGTVSGYVYLPTDAFSVDYFTEIDVVLDGDREIYTDAYTDMLTSMAEAIKPDVEIFANERLSVVKAEALKKYEEGYLEYADGLAEFESAREETLKTLEDAFTELDKAQKEVDSNCATLVDALKKLDAAQKEINAQTAALLEGAALLSDAKAEAYGQLAAGYAELAENKKLVQGSLKQVNDGLAQIEAGLVQLDDGIAQIEDGLDQIADGLKKLELAIGLAKVRVDSLKGMLAGAGGSNADNLIANQIKGELAEAQAELDSYLTQKEDALSMQETLTAQLQELKVQRTQLITQRAELKDTKKTLDSAMAEIADAEAELNAAQKQADTQFAAEEARIESGRIQLEAAQRQVDINRAEAEAGMEALEAGQTELDAAWEEYNTGKAEADEELAKAQAEIDEAAAKLADAKAQIEEMTTAEVFILDRNTNVGYLALDNNSDIVAGVSRVFPAFFLLVAALVCITTMTRMVEEERTQIGTFKALGYSAGSIIRKYMLYAGTAAVFGCGFGVLFGSALLPTILWDVYGILLNITPKIILKLNWPLCITVVSVYTAAMLAVTWFCCKRTLREVPAEMIRPKAPTSGKKIFMEYLPFWKHFSFLNKVMLRNVFRYRQRMLMMLLGIGGCTALLLTGFGLRDSIVNTVPNQFEKITVYDIQIYFSEGQTQEEMEVFRDALQGDVSGIHFYHQTSAELDTGSGVSDLSLIASNQGITNFIHFISDDETLSMPNVGDVYLTKGVAKKMGIGIGDTVTIRDSDLRTLSLKVSGIFENNVQNFAIVLPETVEQQWGYAPANQMAYVNVPEDLDVHEVGTKIAGLNDVLNVSITEDIANSVDEMLKALDMIVVVVVIFAGALAITVMYNLTNINITERIREIATIKVLGFRSLESAAYVFKENLLLTGMGIFVGMFMGKFLLDFVISQIKVDMIWFNTQISVGSYAIAAILTVLVALIVDFLLFFKLEKINMAEALKSVE